MNILHVLYDTYSISGPANSLLTLLDHLPKEQYASFVVMREPGPLVEDIRARGIECLMLALPRPAGLRAAALFSFRLPFELLKLIRFIRKRRIHLIHVHQTPSFWGVIAGKFTGIPVIFHIREIWGYRAYKRMIVRFSAQVIAISHAVKNALMKIIPPSLAGKIAIIYNAVDLDRFDPGKNANNFRQEWNIPEHAPFVLMVSKFIENKGHIDFVRSCAIVKKQFPEAVCMIVGGELPGHEWYADAVKQVIAETGQTETLRVVGFRSDVEQCMAAADVIVQPSTCDEGLGRIPIEAMAMAKPVVATISGGMTEVVLEGKTGCLVPKHDPEALAQAVITLLENPELRREFGQAGCQRAHELFNVQTHVAAIQEIYDAAGKEQ